MTVHRIREAVVGVVKPRVSDEAWQRLRGLEQRARRSAPGETEPAGPPPMETWDLPSLASHFGTDKWGVHRYADHYEHHFGRYKHDPITLLEIGIGGYAREGLGGASLRMWKAFFPRAQIVGLDIEDKSFVDEDRIRTVRGSQVDDDLVRSLVQEADDLRIVVDDGSHRPEHIRQTFATLFPLLPAGALYAIEDTQTSYWPRWGGAMDLDDPTTSMALVKRLVDGLNYEEWQGPDHPATYSDRNIVAVHCYHNLVVIEKGPNEEGTRRGAQERSAPQAAAPDAAATGSAAAETD